ncbi:hypothetical protein F2Q69_00054565 [Brassica cretica]|uniref:Uncharacterized protein n=1 Tax=Brassica cretica TaxID=69181 RepID=A0A8S9N6C3_BRACR|nr:hypothetical protein F2Q69_00054565 [Brassica cretica]
MFCVGYLVNTDALDAPYEKVKPKGVTMTALLAKLQGWLLLSILCAFADILTLSLLSPEDCLVYEEVDPEKEEALSRVSVHR